MVSRAATLLLLLGWVFSRRLRARIRRGQFQISRLQNPK